MIMVMLRIELWSRYAYYYGHVMPINMIMLACYYDQVRPTSMIMLCQLLWSCYANDYGHVTPFIMAMLRLSLWSC